MEGCCFAVLGRNRTLLVWALPCIVLCSLLGVSQHLIRCSDPVEPLPGLLIAECPTLGSRGWLERHKEITGDLVLAPDGAKLTPITIAHTLTPPMQGSLRTCCCCWWA